MIVYLGTFLIALTTLGLEVTLTRLLSVITWYHLAFFAVGTAMLGMTAGASTVYLRPNWFTGDKLNHNIAKACLAYSLAVPLSLIILCMTPLDLSISVMSLLALIQATIACALPFYFSGIAITAVLTMHRYPIGKIYASDLIGASLGCLFVLVGLEIFDASSLIILSGSVGALAALAFAWKSTAFKFRRLSIGVFGVLCLIAFLNSFTSYGIRPFVVKGQIQEFDDILLEKWNSFSRVVVHRRLDSPPQYWGASPQAPRDRNIPQHGMSIDGGAFTTVRRFKSFEDIDHLRFDVTNVAYYLRPQGSACIIGVGGGRDIQSALLFGHEKIVGIDLNPIFIDLLQNQFREFAGISDRKEVTLVVDEARSYLSRSKEEYSIIQMSLTDTFASTGAGAFTLSENTLYTVEAWITFLERLSDDGIFTVSRWHDPKNLGETGRVISLAVASLLEFNLPDPSRHIAMIATDSLSTLLVSRRPFNDQDITELKKLSSDLRFNPVIIPDLPPSNQTLKSMLEAGTLEELELAIADEPLNYQPSTDENPYFFNMLRLNHIKSILWSGPGVMRGNLIANLTLIGLILSLLLISIVTIAIPLVTGSRSGSPTRKNSTILWSGAIYFSLIGAGFMLTEIALIQRLSVFLGHPVYALGILLFTIIASAGIGSYLSEQLPLTRSPWIFIFPVSIFLAIIAIRFFLPVLSSNMMTSSTGIKITLSILVIFPLGILMGVCFPTGMRLVKTAKASETPWYWALNGIFGVLCSAVAVFISIHFGISTSFYLAAACYIMLLFCLPKMYTLHRDSTAEAVKT